MDRITRRGYRWLSRLGGAAVLMLFMLLHLGGWAQPLLLGDLDEDGRATVADLVRLIGYLKDANSMEPSLVYYTDLNEVYW